MGIYSSNWLYYGRLLSAETYKRMVEKEALKPGFVTHLYGDRIILHAPGKCLKVGWIDPIIEAHEVRQGSIDLSEVIGKIEKIPEMWDSWQSTTPEQLEQLDEMIKVAAGDDEDRAFAGTYILECEYSSYGERLGDDIEIVKNLPCI